MSIGYACLAVGVPSTDFKSCIAKNASETKLLSLIAHNLNSLEQIIDYNIANKILLFRISSNLIPFGSSPINRLPWWDVFASKFLSLGEKIKKGAIRVSMHPGQYTILNSPHEDVVNRALEDLNYHCRVLDMLGVGMENKIVLHVGGSYNDKKQATKRFITNYQRLDQAVQERLVLENDDKSYNISEVMEIAKILHLPVIFDNLHHLTNPCTIQRSDLYWIDACGKTWGKKDGCQKIHYSQQNPGKKPGAHSDSIRIKEFMEFYKKIKSKDIDIMLEVKDKNLSAIKCINCTSSERVIKDLENE